MHDPERGVVGARRLVRRPFSGGRAHDAERHVENLFALLRRVARNRHRVVSKVVLVKRIYVDDGGSHGVTHKTPHATGGNDACSTLCHSTVRYGAVQNSNNLRNISSTRTRIRQKPFGGYDMQVRVKPVLGTGRS